MIPKKEENGEKVATATTEAEFHAALNSGADVELTHELAEKIGLMVEDVGTPRRYQGREIRSLQLRQPEGDRHGKTATEADLLSGERGLRQAGE